MVGQKGQVFVKPYILWGIVWKMWPGDIKWSKSQPEFQLSTIGFPLAKQESAQIQGGVARGGGWGQKRSQIPGWPERSSIAPPTAVPKWHLLCVSAHCSYYIPDCKMYLLNLQNGFPELCKYLSKCVPKWHLLCPLARSLAHAIKCIDFLK